MIGIRADANKIISTGHIMRCIAIAQQLDKLNQKFVFIVADSFAANFLFEKGYDCICLNTNWKDKDSETEKIVKCIIRNNIKKLIIDSYEITQRYLENLKKHVKIIYIDDLNKFQYPVDVLVNYGINVNYKMYSYYSNQNILFLLGTKYTPLRKEFQNKIIKIRKNVTDIFVTTGGSDNLGVVERILSKIITKDDYSKIRFHVIMGSFFLNQEKLKLMVRNNINIILYSNVKNMADIMLKCDIAISAGGTTLAELCACGLPTICFAIADNQIRGIELFCNEKIMISVGDIRDNINESIESIFLALEKLMGNMILREQLSNKGKSCIDGNGAKIIAMQVVNL